MYVSTFPPSVLRSFRIVCNRFGIVPGHWQTEWRLREAQEAPHLAEIERPGSAVWAWTLLSNLMAAERHAGGWVICDHVESPDDFGDEEPADTRQILRNRCRVCRYVNHPAAQGCPETCPFRSWSTGCVERFVRACHHHFMFPGHWMARNRTGRLQELYGERQPWPEVTGSRVPPASMKWAQAVLAHIRATEVMHAPTAWTEAMEWAREVLDHEEQGLPSPPSPTPPVPRLARKQNPLNKKALSEEKNARESSRLLLQVAQELDDPGEGSSTGKRRRRQ